MGGSTKQTSTTDSTTKTDPWAPTIGQAQVGLQQLEPQWGNTGANPTENAAFAGLMANAQKGNPYASQIGNLATNLLNGGGPDRSGYATDAYGGLQNSLNPIANQSTNPYDNQTFQNFANTLTNDTTDRIKSAYAGAGYTAPSTGDFGQQLGRGISQGLAPTFLQAQDTLTNQKMGAANALNSGGANLSGLLSGLDQTKLSNQQAGIGASTAALQANDSPYNQMLSISQQQRQLPLQNIGNVSSLLLPYAQLGGTSNTNATTTSEKQVPMGQQILGGALGGAGLLSGLGGFGPTGWLYGSGGSSGLLNGLFGSK